MEENGNYYGIFGLKKDNGKKKENYYLGLGFRKKEGVVSGLGKVVLGVVRVEATRWTLLKEHTKEEYPLHHI